MIKLLKNANVYAPEKLGKKDILIEGEKILLMQDTIEGYEGLPGVETYDLEGKTVVPAYIDMHVHITGGGGEQGPASRVPESQLSEFFKNGITTVVGLLGTDGVSMNPWERNPAGWMERFRAGGRTNGGNNSQSPCRTPALQSVPNHNPYAI